MSLKTRVDVESTSSWIHCGNELGVLDVHKRQLVLIIPMLIVSVLSEESNSCLGVIRIWTRHVQIVHEVDQFFGSLRSKQSTGFLFQLLLKNQLEKIGSRVEVEVNNLLDVVAVCT